MRSLWEYCFLRIFPKILTFWEKYRYFLDHFEKINFVHIYKNIYTIRGWRLFFRYLFSPIYPKIWTFQRKWRCFEITAFLPMFPKIITFWVKGRFSKKMTLFSDHFKKRFFAHIFKNNNISSKGRFFLDHFKSRFLLIYSKLSTFRAKRRFFVIPMT